MIAVQVSVELSYVLALLWYGLVLILLCAYLNWILESVRHRNWGSVAWKGTVIFFLLISALPFASHDVTQWYARLAELRGW